MYFDRDEFYRRLYIETSKTVLFIGLVIFLTCLIVCCNPAIAI